MPEKSPELGIKGGNSFVAINTPEFLALLLVKGSERQAAYRELVEGMQGPLLSYSRKFVSSPEEAQEIVQEVYLGVFKGLAGFSGQSKLTTWIYGLAHYKICDRLSDKFRKFEELEDGQRDLHEKKSIDWDLAEMLKATPWDLPPDKFLLHSAVKTLIADAVTRLSAPAMEIYHLRDIQGLSGEEVAEALGLSPVTVRVRLHRARNQIVTWVREQMKSKGPIQEVNI